MGDQADMMVDGTVCMTCGEDLDGHAETIVQGSPAWRELRI